MGHDAQFESTAFPPVPFPTLDHGAEQLCHVYLLPNKCPVQVSALRTHTCPTCIKGARSLQSRNLQFGFSSGGSWPQLYSGSGSGSEFAVTLPRDIAGSGSGLPPHTLLQYGGPGDSPEFTNTHSHKLTRLHTHSLTRMLLTILQPQLDVLNSLEADADHPE